MHKIKEIIKEKVIEIMNAIRDRDLPPLLLGKYRASLFLSLGIIFISIMFIIIYGLKGNNVSGFLFPIMVSLLILLTGTAFKINISLNGYLELSGECVLLNTRLKKVNSYVLKVEDVYVIIPIQKKLIPPVGSQVTVYLSGNSPFYEDSNGYRHYTKILGYILS